MHVIEIRNYCKVALVIVNSENKEQNCISKDKRWDFFVISFIMHYENASCLAKCFVDRFNILLNL